MTPVTIKKPSVVITEVDLTDLVWQALPRGQFGPYNQYRQSYHIEVFVPEGHLPNDPKIVVALVEGSVPGLNTSMSINEIVSHVRGFEPKAVVIDHRSPKTKR